MHLPARTVTVTGSPSPRGNQSSSSCPLMAWFLGISLPSVLPLAELQLSPCPQQRKSLSGRERHPLGEGAPKQGDSAKRGRGLWTRDSGGRGSASDCLQSQVPLPHRCETKPSPESCDKEPRFFPHSYLLSHSCFFLSCLGMGCLSQGGNNLLLSSNKTLRTEL